MTMDSRGNLSLLFIPDISGFTKFVTINEINHSQHIIAELLEIIIDSDELGLTVSEIEGDAVLFYEYRKVPPVDKILTQTKKTFLAFHNHLKRYERDRVCECGACSTASQLSLKIIAHTGNITLINVKDHKKPYGPDVILVHRLLKNKIKENEYLLFTDHSFGKLKESDLESYKDWAKITGGSTSYEDLGEISYKYIPLSPLYDHVTAPEPVTPRKKISGPIVKEIYIERPPDELFELISSLELRPQWTRNLEQIDFDRRKVNRVGTEHVCVLDGKELKFETVTNDFGEDKQVYGERLMNAPLMKEVTNYFIFEARGSGTKLRVESHYFPFPVIGWLFKPFFKSAMAKNLENLLDSLKEYSEKGC